MGMRIGYLYAVRSGRSASLGIAWYGPMGAARHRSQAYRSADGRTLPEAVKWAAEDWCGYMANEGHSGSILFVDAACATAAPTEKIRGQYVVYGIDGMSVTDTANPFFRLASLARREACRMPHALRSVLSEAYSAYGQYMPAGALDRLDEKWPDVADQVQAAISGACTALDQAWERDDSKSAYGAAIALAGAIRSAVDNEQ